MYDEVEYHINWASKFKKAIIVIGIIILIGIIVLSFLKNKPKVQNNFFEDNLNTMIKVAKNYYQNNENLDKITLKEMLDKKMMLEFYDENGHTCDLYSSYAKKENNKIEVYLKCETKQDSKTNFI